MATLLDRISSRREPERASLPLSFADFAAYFTYGNNQYPFMLNQTMPGQKTEDIPQDFQGLTQMAYKRNGIVFAVILTRLLLFSQARFQFQQMVKGRPGDLFGTEDLRVLEYPEPGKPTGWLAARAEQDVSLAGNFYATNLYPGMIKRMRPDWVSILMGSLKEPDLAPYDLGAKVVGYVYHPGGRQSGVEPIALHPEQVAHYAPIPDPDAYYRGMSWLTPIVQEIQADQAATSHKKALFENAATPNTIVSLSETDPDKFNRWVEKFRENHEGAANAYRCLHPETEVALWNGARCRADEVRPGDTVVAWADGKATPGVVAAVEEQPPSPIVTVTTQRGRVVKTNEPHPFLTKDGWVAAGDLQPGDLLTTGLGWGRPRLQDTINSQEAWLLGLLVGDGSFVASSPGVTISNEAVLARAGGVANLVKLPHRSIAPYDYRVRGVADLVRTQSLNGKRSHEKRVPPGVMAGGVEVVGAFLSGLIDADGHVANPKIRSSAEVGITSTSRGLLADVQHLLASLGVNASISSPPSMKVGAAGGSSGAPRRHDAHRLHVHGNHQAARLKEILDLAHDKKREYLDVYASRASKQDRSRYDRVVSVTVGSPEPTIGIEVAGHHTHVTGGVVSHNTLFLGAGADATVVGANLQEMDFRRVQGGGETRVAAAGGVPPVVVGLSEGLASATYANYGQARRRLADGTMRPLWEAWAGAFSLMVPAPSGARLWYDARDVSFLQEDEKDAADIQKVQAEAASTLVTAGYEPDSVIAFLSTNDVNRLKHTGLPSVQLQKGGQPPEQPPSDQGT